MLLIFFTLFFFFSNLFQTSNLIFATSTIDGINHHGSESDNNVDRLSLLAIKSQITHDPHGVLNSWNNSHSVCQWEGVTCNTMQRVVNLTLYSYGLVGTLSPSVGNLSFLHHLSLGDNDFKNHIPPQIGRLHRLRTLILEGNSFEGEIPANISRCLKLQVLSVARNHLSGNIPPQFSHLSNLLRLYVGNNRFTGDLFNTAVMNMTSLQWLSAPTNSFYGTFPDNFGGALRNLIVISLGQNQISGTIPSSFYNLSSLHLVQLDFNRLEGTVPFDIGSRLPQLTDFNIAGNLFHGSLPVSLSNLTQLVILSVYSNKFTGKFKFSAKNMPNLNILDISENYLGTGGSDDLSFIQTLANCTKLLTLECGSNRFGGILPHSLGNLSTNLTYVDLSQNLITGSIPLELFNLINLTQLDLSGNQLSGYLPRQIKNLRKLVAFSCSDNHLIGDIPSSLGNLSRLSLLYLQNNHFEGTIPSSLGECTNLLLISFSNNNLSGPLPSNLFKASMLNTLRLDQNHLQGVIPTEINQLKNLVVFDISENSFSGEVPSSLGSCTELLELHMGGNSIIGSIPQSFTSLTSIMLLNLSHNRFTGEIPSFLCNISVLDVIDLSFNDFEGEVPTQGVFAILSAVAAVGNNKLCGGIPELHLPICSNKPTTPSKKKGGLSLDVTLIIAIASLVIGVSIVSVSYFLLCSKKKQSKGSSLNLKESFSKVSYNMILKATAGFSEANLLGSGGFGSVYKGVLDLESHVVVAVKVIKLEQKGARKSFMAECEALRKIRHRNLVKVVTACSSTDFQGNDFKALIYEFMPNGNLQHWIRDDQHQKALSLIQRLSIAIDVASALDYLHNNYDVPIIHCDLKPSNILLDNDMVAHVGDFGLAKFHVHASTYNSSSVAVKGTVGYAAPEYGLGSMVSKEGDMYSYGIVLIEMMTGKNPTDGIFEESLDLHKYAKAAFSDELTKINDPTLLDDSAIAGDEDQAEILAGNECKIKCIRSVIEIGVKCSLESPQDRMRTEDAFIQLQRTRDSFLKELSYIR